MKILVAHPGSDTSTGDVHRGMCSALEKRGHVLWQYALNARISVAGAYLHYAWRRGGKTCEKPSPADVLYKASEELISRALRVQPDVVLVVSAMYLHPDVFLLLKRAGMKVACLFTESPYDDEMQARLLPYIDVAWTNERVSASKMGIKYLPHAYNADLHDTHAAGSHVPAHDVIFVGTGFKERIELLEEIDWTGINLGLYGSWKLMGSRSKLQPFVKSRDVVDNHVAISLCKRAKVCLNHYRSSKGFGKDAPRIDHAESLNPRAYELAATGCFQISSARLEVFERFESLVPQFQNPGELQELLRAWLADDLGRERARKLLPVCVKGHSWDDRARQIEQDLAEAGIASGNAEQAAVVNG